MCMHGTQIHLSLSNFLNVYSLGEEEFEVYRFKEIHGWGSGWVGSIPSL